MDIQDRLYVTHTFIKKVDTINLSNLKNIGSENVLFYFNEYEPIVIKNDSDNYNVTIECISYYQNGEYKNCENNLLTLEKGIEYKISDSNNTIDIGYIPSKYQIFIKNNVTNYKTHFEVRYNSESPKDGMENIIESINSFVDGLSIDFFSNSPINNIHSDKNLSTYYIYEILSKNKKKIIYNCERILSNLKYNVVGNIKRDSYERRQNTITLRKNNLRSLSNYNYNIKKTISNFDIDNVILKEYLFRILKILNNSLSDIKNVLDKEKTKKFEYEQILAKNTNKLVEKQLSSTDRSDIRNLNKSKSSEIDNINSWIKTLEKWDESYKICNLYIARLKDCEELQMINICGQLRYSSTFIKNNNYNFFAKLYNELILNQTNQHQYNKNSIFSDKKSYALFEIYGFIIIQNILKELNFCFANDQWDLFTFGSDIEFVFIKKEIKIKVQYDHYCEKYRNLNNIKNGDIVNINSHNCKPDYIISFYEKDVLKDAVIVEMKYRKLKYMVQGGGSTETDVTIDDYSQLGGIVDVNARPENIVSDVIILYPSQKERIFKHNNGEFIGINVSKDFGDSDGYNKLKQIIIQTINNFAPIDDAIESKN